MRTSKWSCREERKMKTGDIFGSEGKPLKTILWLGKRWRRVTGTPSRWHIYTSGKWSIDIAKDLEEYSIKLEHKDVVMWGCGRSLSAALKNLKKNMAKPGSLLDG
jgi:hypothetical protein